MHSFPELLKKFEDRFNPEAIFPGMPANLYEPCKYILGIGGKRVRPVLCLMANELFGPINEDAWNASYAVELFHNFTLIHDDIMDKAPLRRGMPTIHNKYGLTSGILSGDVMNIFAYQSLAKVSNSLQKLMELFNQTAIEVCEGQQLDMDFEQRNDVTIEEYINMIALKTSVLLACSLKMGAITGGGMGDNANKLYAFGRNLGLAFQLQDDYLDAFGDPEKSGKQVGGDILANKKTILLIQALNVANEQQRQQINTLLESDTTDKVEKMLTLFRTLKVDEYCREQVHYYSELAFKNMDDVAIPSARKEPLLQLAQYLLMRDK